MGKKQKAANYRHIEPTNNEVFFGEEEIIVSKTDPQGRILYANDVFLKIAGYSEAEVLGQPHSLIRHPDMPRSVFKLLWDTIGAGGEIFAYVKNMTKTGDYYWVFAHVTPSFDADNNIVGYHSNRRCPDRDSVETVAGLYAKVLAEENRHADRKAGLASGEAILGEFISSQGKSYEELVHAL